MVDGEPMDTGDVAGPSATSTRGGLSPEASRLFRVYKTLSAMLNKRGYMIPREMRDMTPTDFTSKFGEFPTREGLTILVVRAVEISCVLPESCSFVHIFANLTNIIIIILPLTTVMNRRKKQMMK